MVGVTVPGWLTNQEALASVANIKGRPNGRGSREKLPKNFRGDVSARHAASSPLRPSSRTIGEIARPRAAARGAERFTPRRREWALA